MKTWLRFMLETRKGYFASVDANGAQLKPGYTVTIMNLKRSPELNGKEGTRVSWNATGERWSVQLPTGGIKAIRPHSLMRTGMK